MDMESKNAYEIKQIVPILGSERVTLDGDIVKLASLRYHTFQKNLKCVTCGLEGVYFLKEKDHKNHPFHLNLYGVTFKGERVLMTKDHILPASRGGRTILENLQTMCSFCNSSKGDQMMSPVDSIVPRQQGRWDTGGKPGVFRQQLVSLNGYPKLYTVRT